MRIYLLYFSFYFCLRFPHDQIREIVITFQKILKRRRKQEKRGENVILFNTEGVSKNNNLKKKNLNQN